MVQVLPQTLSPLVTPAKALGADSYAFGSGAEATGLRSFAFGSVGIDTLGNPTSNKNKGYRRLLHGSWHGSSIDQYRFDGLRCIHHLRGWPQPSRVWWYGNWQFFNAIGFRAKASTIYSTAVGYYAVVYGDYGHSFGYRANAYGSLIAGTWVQSPIQLVGCCRYGLQSCSFKHELHCHRVNAQSTGQNAVAMGYSPLASNTYAVAIGYYAKATTTNAYSFGYYSEAAGDNSFAIGMA
ncbi:MAG: hypothetical protein U0X39_02175 [Bacteroidales bacterium]